MVSAVSTMMSSVSTVSAVSTVVSSVMDDCVLSVKSSHWSSVVAGDWSADVVSLSNGVVVSHIMCDNMIVIGGVSRDAVNAVETAVGMHVRAAAIMVVSVVRGSAYRGGAISVVSISVVSSVVASVVSSVVSAGGWEMDCRVGRVAIAVAAVRIGVAVAAGVSISVSITAAVRAGVMSISMMITAAAGAMSVSRSINR